MRSYLHVLKEELRREWVLSRRYWLNLLSFALNIYLFFLILVLVGHATTGEPMPPAARASALVGMLVWQLSLGAIHVMGWSFYNEASTGTLEHLYLSPVGVTTVLLARSVAQFCSALVVMAVSGALTMLTTGVRLHLPPLALALILPVAVAGAYGFGFLLAALTLTFKRTQQLLNLVQFVLLLPTGAVVPLSHLPWAVQVLGEWLPLTAGLRALRAVAVVGAGLGDVAGDLVRAAAVSAAWLALGIAAYRLADRRARRLGTLGQY